jgi:hypothetical protein
MNKDSENKTLKSLSFVTSLLVTITCGILAAKIITGLDQQEQLVELVCLIYGLGALACHLLLVDY